MIDLKPYYTMVEISNLLKKDYMTAKRTLTKLGIPVDSIGGRKIVYIINIKDYCPDLYRSILECLAVNSDPFLIPEQSIFDHEIEGEINDEFQRIC